MTISGTSDALSKSSNFDFRFKFWVGPEYRDVWADEVIAGAWGSASGYDFTDWSVPSWVSTAGMFTEFTSKITGMEVSNRQQGAIGKWTVTLSGNSYDSLLLANERTVVCTAQVARRVNGAFLWSSEGLFLIGSITGFAPEASYAINGAFKLTVTGISHYMDVKDLPPQSWGKSNIAEGKTCAWRTTLLDASQLDNKGEFVGSQISLVADNAVDGVIYGAPACSSTPPLNEQYTRNLNNTRGFIRELYLWPPAGYGPQYQWISVSANVRTMLTYGKGEFHGDVGHDENQTCFYHTYTPYPQGNGGSLDEVGIFCYNRTCVEELFDISGAAWVVEWGKEMPGYYINPNQDFVIVNSGEVHNPICDYVKWSTTNPSWTITDNDIANFVECGGSWTGVASHWTGNCLNPSTISPGQSLARKKYANSVWTLDGDTNTPGDWMFNSVPMPLAFADKKDPQWAVLDLGEMNCKLAANFTTGTYPATMQLDTAFGLSGSGKVIIGQRILNYDTRTNTSLHITGGEAGTYTLTANSPVYQYDNVTSTAKRGYRISHIRFWRKPGLSHIKVAELHASGLTGSLRTPSYAANPQDQDPWWLDWGALGHYKNGLTLNPPQTVVETGLVEVALPYEAANPEKNRFTQIMLNVFAMHGNNRAVSDPLYVAPDGYFLLNEIEVYVDETTDGSARTITESTAGNIIKSTLVNELGVPAAKVYVSPYATATFRNQITARSKHTSVLSEIAASYGLSVTEALDGTIHVTPDPWWPAQSYAYSQGTEFSFSRSTLSQLSENAGPARAVAQAKIEARDPEGKFSFIGTYPATPGDYGDIVSGDATYICASKEVADKIAEAVYRRADSNITIQAATIAPAPWLRPNMLISLDWPYEDSAVRHSLWIITSVDHTIVMGNVANGDVGSKDWATTFTARAFTYSGALPRPEKPK